MLLFVFGCSEPAKPNSAPDADSADTASVGCGGANVALLGDAGFTTLQAAIDAAASGEEVSLCAGVLIDENVRVEESITIAGSSPDLPETIRGVGDGPVIDAEAPLTLRNVVLTGGTGALVDGVRRGGGLYAPFGATLDAAFISGNSADDGGGAWIGGTSTMRTGSFDTNSATRGGGLYLARGGSLAVLDWMLDTSNTASEGGGVYMEGGTALGGGQVIHNTADTGGGIFVNATGDTVTIDGTEVNSNAATDGGGVAIYGAGSVGILHGYLDFNTADRGGAIFADGARLEMAEDTVQLNEARQGAGIWTNGAASAELLTLENNAAAEEGGGIYAVNASGEVTLDLVASQIAENSASSGGGAFVFGASGTLSSEATWWGDGGNENTPEAVFFVASGESTLPPSDGTLTCDVATGICAP